MYKVIFVDIDGTLTDDKGVIYSYVVSALERLRKKNIKVILTSGNAYVIAVGLAYYLPVYRFVVAENGAVIGFWKNYRVIGNTEAALKAKALVVERLKSVVYESWQNEFRIADFAFVPREGITMDQATYLIRSAVKGLPVQVDHSGWAIHIRDVGVNKGTGIREACDVLNIEPWEAIAIGDSDTDVSMFKEVGIGIALGNSTAKLRDVATYITNNKFGLGFVEAVKKIEEIIS